MIFHKNSHKNYSFFYSVVVLLCCFFAMPQLASAVSGDFDADGKADVLWYNTVTGDVSMWLMNGTSITSPRYVARVSAPGWAITSVGNFDGALGDDILWRNSNTGEVHIWIMNGGLITANSGYVGTVADLNWKIVDTGDYDADGKADILWHNSVTGAINIWFMNGANLVANQYVAAVSSAQWKVVGSGNFDGTFGDDIVWKNKINGQIHIWYMNGSIVSGGYVGAVNDLNWEIAGIGDFDTTIGFDDILWRNKVTGQNQLWSMNGRTIVANTPLNTVVGANWKITSIGDFDGDSIVDYLMRNVTTGQIEMYLMGGPVTPRMVAAQTALPTISDVSWIVSDPINTSPFVDAGADLTIGIATAGIPLVATAADGDGDPLTTTWQFMGFTPSILTKSGAAPGTATFDPATGKTALATRFTPTTIGLYDFKVTVSDAVASTSATIRINFTNELVGVLPKSLRDAPVPLNTIPVVPASAEVAGSGLTQYIPDTVAARTAAVKLGKALFWDMQVGSDGKQACATCHFHAGTDNRIANTMNRGPDGVFNFDGSATNIGPNQTLTAAKFPLHLFNTPDDRFSGVARTTDDIVGAEGVYDRLFLSLNPGSGLENSTANPILPDTNGFSVGLVNVRRVTGRNAPTVINAVFNLRNFHDGRARHHFNGANPFGNLDTTVTTATGTPILRAAVPLSTGGVGAGNTAPFVVTGLNRSSLASQAVGPPLSDFEMSHGGKTFPTLGKKLLDRGLVPLGTQLVDTTDSVLGAISNQNPAFGGPGTQGISENYRMLIKAAFDSHFWDSNHKYTLDASGVPVDQGVFVPVGPNEFELMEVNFSLFFGLAVQMYESTLVADQTPFDAFLGSTAPYLRSADMTTAGMQARSGAAIPANPAALTGPEQSGMTIFFGKGLCFNCHGGPEMTLAGVNALGLIGVVGEVPEFPVEKMIGGQAGQQGTLDFATAGVTNPLNTGVVLLDFDPRGKTIEISKQQPAPLAPVVVYSSVFPGVASATCTPQQLAIDLLATAVPPIGGVATADFFILPDCSRTFAVSLAQSITIPPTFPPLGTYTVKVLNPPVGTAAPTLASAHASNNLVLATVPLIYDLGFYNIGVRPTTDDAGLGGTAPGGLPLSLAQLAKNTGISEFTLNPGINLATDPVSNINGAFKVPGLRNVALTGPYFHNGGKSTLEQVINHYDAGGDFHEANLVDLAPEIFELFLSPREKANLAAFLRALTDPRVANESAPFDHPSFSYPEGQNVAGGGATDIMNSIPAVGAGGLSAKGLPPLKPFDDPAGGSILTP